MNAKKIIIALFIIVNLSSTVYGLIHTNIIEVGANTIMLILLAFLTIKEANSGK
jgi:hypothetical protein